MGRSKLIEKDSTISKSGELIQVNIHLFGTTVNAKNSYFSIEYNDADPLDYPTFEEVQQSQGGNINQAGGTALSLCCIDDNMYEYSYYLTLDSSFSNKCTTTVHNADQGLSQATILKIYK